MHKSSSYQTYMFVCFQGRSEPLRDESNPYLQSSLSVVSPIYELPCGGDIGGLDFNIFYLLHVTLAPGH